MADTQEYSLMLPQELELLMGNCTDDFFPPGKASYLNIERITTHTEIKQSFEINFQKTFHPLLQ